MIFTSAKPKKNYANLELQIVNEYLNFIFVNLYITSSQTVTKKQNK